MAATINKNYSKPHDRATMVGDKLNSRLELALDGNDTPQECVESVTAKPPLHASDKAGVTSAGYEPQWIHGRLETSNTPSKE